MKTKILTAFAIVILLFMQKPLIAQWITNGTTNNFFAQPDNTGTTSDYIRSIGIGYFGSNYTNSLLHIDGNNILLPQNNSIVNAGEVFRTDAPSGNSTYWRMLRAANQIGYIWNSTSNNHFNLQAHQTTGNIAFYTSPSTAGTGIERMTIIPNGNVGIGIANPTFRLHVDGGDINIDNNTDGYRIAGNYVLRSLPVGSIEDLHVGNGAGFSNTSGYGNTFVGYFAGSDNTTGIGNTYLGNQAGASNQTGFFNTILGDLAGANNTNNNNTFVGYNTGFFNSTAQGNTMVGRQAGFNTTTGGDNTFLGDMAAFNNTTGQRNVFIGDQAAPNNTTGQHNIAIGFSAANNNVSGINNILIGSRSRTDGTALTNAIAIGTDAQVDASNSMVLGSINGINGATANTNVGIGTTAPSTRLHIVTTAGAGTGFRLVDGTQAANRVLTSDANGNASWQAPPTAAVTTCATPVQNMLTKWCNNGTSVFGNSIVIDDGSRVGISTIQSSTKFNVNNNNSLIGSISFTNTANTFFSIGSLGAAENSPFANVGVCGNAPYNNSFWGLAPLLTINSTLTNAIPYNAGVVGRAQGASFNFGGIFEANQNATPACTTYNVGIYASAGRNCSTQPMAGFFRGDIYSTGNIFPLSDVQLKDSIAPLTAALTTINKLHAKSYVFKNSVYPYMNLPAGKNYGLISQQVDSVLPELISTILIPQVFDSIGNILEDTVRVMTLNYTGLIPITIAAIQEQQQMIDSLAATQVSAQTNPTDTNRIVKWSGVNNVLANSLLYDNGTAIGMPTVKPGSYFNVANTSDTVALSVSSTHSSTTAVVDVVYNGGTATDHAVAVRGTAIHAISGGGTGGWGARFEGGQLGVAGIGIGNNSTVAGVYGSASGASFLNAGVLGNAEAVADTINAGIYGASANAEMMNAGIVGGATESSASAINYGSYNVAARSQHENMAGYFNAEDTIGLNYGVYSEVYAMDSDAWAGYFKGNVHYTGRLTAGSDAKLKANIQPLKTDSALALLAKLQPKTYTYNSSAVQNLGMPTGKQYGLIAQEVQQVLPELVSHITQPETRNLKGQVIHQQEHYLGLNYQGLIPVLIGAVNEQQRKIDSLNNLLNNKLAALENRINNCCGIGGINHKTDETTPNENAVSVELSNTQVIVLEQNAPNPFAEQTTINYHIPTGMGDGQMVFTDMLGNIIKTAEVKNGYGTLTVFAQNLSSGQYSYTLIVNGKTIATKKMMKQR